MKRISRSKMRCLQVAVCFAIGLFMLVGSSLAFDQATNSALRHRQRQRQQQQQSQQQNSVNSITSYNNLGNLDNLISDIMMEADSRLKKSKGNTLRQVKQTLRFGRSDPWYPANSQEEQLSLTMDESNDDQSRLPAFNIRRRR